MRFGAGKYKIYEILMARLSKYEDRPLALRKAQGEGVVLSTKDTLMARRRFSAVSKY